MEFVEFKIKNFKGIENITFNIDKSPKTNIYALIGLNESGKTTILEAINLFEPNNESMSVLEIPGSSIVDYNDMIPISKRDNFNGVISLEVKVKLDKTDKNKINSYVSAKTNLKKIEEVSYLIYYRKYYYENSIFQRLEKRWTGFRGIIKESNSRTFIEVDGDDNTKLSHFCKKLIPSILYFPNFLFDFPSKILLETNADTSPKENFYIDLIQDILNSLGNDTDLNIHLVNRIKSSDKSQKRNLDRLVQKMELKITDIVFDAWNRIFNRQIKDTRVSIRHGINENKLAYLEFEIESEDGIYQINERSLGFKWFFTFLLFTQFRPYRKDTPQNVIFLFDEPASNLHSLAQTQLLKSFERLTNNCKIIYTTHSHHLINPHWLEGAYIVKNEGLKLEDPNSYNIKQTKISIQSYRDFATKHPHNTAYFQPILDVLEYSPSNLESLPNCIFIEGKNDYYTLEYFRKIIIEYNEDINLTPSTGSGNLDTLISLYIGWGREFIILLDSDQAGKKEKERYCEKFGIIVEKRIFTLEDINSNWDNIAMEKLLSDEEKISFQKISYPDSEKYNKTHFNRSIQENLIEKNKFNFSEGTINNFKDILSFVTSKINK